MSEPLHFAGKVTSSSSKIGGSTPPQTLVRSQFIRSYISIIFKFFKTKCARLILKQPSRTHASPLLQSLHWLSVEKRILFKLIVQAFKAFHFSSPGYLSSYFQSRVHKTKYSLCSDLAITFEVPCAKKTSGQSCLLCGWASSLEWAAEQCPYSQS